MARLKNEALMMRNIPNKNTQGDQIQKSWIF